MGSKNNSGNLSDTRGELAYSFLEIQNPYQPFDIAATEWFYHENIIKEIKNKFETQPENKAVILQGKPCSGKTTLLKRIENNAALLGKNYVPIYLDSTEYIGLDIDDLLYSVYKDIIDKLNKRGYNIPIPGDIRKRRISHSTFESLLLLFDAYLTNNEVLLVIFDEFDKLLENVQLNAIEEYIELSRYIEKSWSNYGIILAGDKHLLNLTNSQIINHFLEELSCITVEVMFEDETLRNWITEPVEDQLNYDSEAVDRILWYCGKNLFFEQLICFYIVNHLNEKIRNIITGEKDENTIERARLHHCSLQDVEEAVQRILKEKISEFSYVWNKKLTTNAKLIVSALADESVTEKKGTHYLFKENKLLESIFGNRMYKEIEELQDFGYINRMHRRYFRDCPFKIPLYGKWVRKEHPFLKTLIENIDTIAEKIDLGVLRKNIEKTPESQLTLFDKEMMLEIAKEWCSLTDRIIRQKKFAEKSQIISFIESFSRRLNLDVKQKPRPNENYFVIDVRNLQIGVLDEALCFIQHKPELKSDDIFNIETKAAAFEQKAQTKLTLFFHLQKDEMVEELIKKPYLSLISIDESDLKKIILSETPFECFRRIILSRLSLNKISPYEIAGPTTSIFYGRNDIINRIVSTTNKSFAIVGARKIGKTSLLLKIKDNRPPNTVFIFVNLESIFPNMKDSTKKEGAKNKKPFMKGIGFGKSTNRSFLKTFLDELESVFNKKIGFARLPLYIDISKLPKIIQKFSQDGKKIVFIFDEIDGLIAFDKKNDYRYLRQFRAMSQNDDCQFIFAGFKELYRYKRVIDNPLYNFCEEIKLKPLDREAAFDLISKPMESIGIHYKNDKYRDTILDYTGSHPNLLQFYCKNLIERVEKHENVEDRRTISFEDIEELFDTTYEEYIMDEVYMFNSDLNKLDKLILILLVEALSGQTEKTFSINDIKELLSLYGINTSKNDLHQVLRNLVMRFILLDEGKDNYKFSLPVFPEILEKRIDDDIKKEIIEEIKANA